MTLQFKKKLGSSGHAHLALAAVLIVVGFAMYGTYKLVISHADTVTKQSAVTKKSGCTTTDSAKAAGGTKKANICPGDIPTDPHTPATPAQPVTPTPAQVMADCASKLHQTYDMSNNKCSGICLTGYTMVGTTCTKVATTAPAIVKADCAAQHKIYVSETNQCSTRCVVGYVVKGNDCTPIPTTQTPAEVKANCENVLHQTYASATNRCTGTCMTGYKLIGTTCTKVATNDSCDPSKSKCTDPASVRASCEAQHKLYSATANSCSAKCVSGYVLKNDICTLIPTPAQIKAGCETIFHQTYNATTNACSGVCITGYAMIAGVCTKSTTTDGCGNGDRCLTPVQVKAYCAAQHLVYSTVANKCQDDCVTDYVMRDGKCIDKTIAQNTMSDVLCRRLGRLWVTPARQTSEGINPTPKPAYCSSTCLDTASSKYVATKDNLTSYCKASEAGSLGVATGMTKEACQAQNRIWMVNAQVCSARCTEGWYLKDKACVETKAHADQASTLCAGGVIPATDGSCPEDTSSPQQAPTATTVAVEANVSKKNCELLGREWVPAGKNAAGKKVAGGCSTESCLKKDVKIHQSNGSYYCQGYVIRIDQQRCVSLHRVWQDDVNGCASRVNQDKTAGKRVANAPECQKPYTTYVYKSDQYDECLKPATVEKLQSVASATGTPFIALTNMSQAGICNLKPHMHWNGHACVKDRVIQTVPTGGPVSSPTGDTNVQPGFQVTAAFCTSLGRPYSSGTCTRSCTNTAYYLPHNNATAATHGYDRCVAKPAVSTGGVNCPAPMWEINGECVGHGAGGTGGQTAAVTQKDCQGYTYWGDHTSACTSYCISHMTGSYHPDFKQFYCNDYHAALYTDISYYEQNYGKH